MTDKMNRKALVSTLTAVVVAAVLLSPGVACAQTARNVAAEVMPPTKGYEFGWWTYLAASPSVLHWRFALELSELAPNLQDALAQASAVKIANYVGSDAQRVSRQIPRALGPGLFVNERRGVSLLSGSALAAYRVDAIPADAMAARDLFEFVQAMKIGTLIVDSVPANVNAVDVLGQHYGIDVALCGPYKLVAEAMRRAPKGVGACLDAGALVDQGVDAVAAITELKERLLIVQLPSQSKVGASCDNACFLGALYRLQVKPSLIVLRKGAGADNVSDLQRATRELEPALRPLIAAEALRRSRLPDQGRGDGAEDQRRYARSITAGNSLQWDPVTPDRRAAIDKALPKKAIVKPKKPRKLLVIDLNLGYPGHTSIPTHNYGIRHLGEQTGAYEAVFDNDLDNLKYPKVRDYDAIFLNNTVGLIFSDPEVREGLLRFVREGGGLGGNHASTHASLDWPQFAEMIGAYPGGHLEPTEQVWLKIDDPKSPLNAAFGGKTFLYQDEFFRFPIAPYGRDTLRVLLSIDTSRTDMAQGSDATFTKAAQFGNSIDLMGREDADYAVSWIKTYGEGRVFYTTMGHVPTMFMTPEIAYHMLGGLQFILGDLQADAAPSARASAAR